MRAFRVCLSSTLLLAALAATSGAQEEAPPAEAPPAAEEAPAEEAPAEDVAPVDEPQSLEQRVAALDAELEQLKQKLDGDDDELSGWQLQLRGSWHTLAHNHRDSVFKADDHQHGWGVGLGLMVPLWTELAPTVDLYGHFALEYRQVAYSTVTRAPITNASGTISYLNMTVAPTLRFPVTDMLRPFVFGGFNMIVASPPNDAIGYLDVGFVLGGGIDLAVHERISVGMEYKYSWYGVADMEEEDYGQLTGYIGFNF